MRRILNSVLAGIAMAAAMPAFASASGGADPTCRLMFSNGVTLENIPVAKTNSAQAKGLSGRADVGPGMLFTWPESKPRAVWMHDTHQPLTLGFFDASGVLFHIEDMAADTDGFHLSMQPAMHTLELPAGGFARAGLVLNVRLTGWTCKGEQ